MVPLVEVNQIQGFLPARIVNRGGAFFIEAQVIMTHLTSTRQFIITLHRRLLTETELVNEQSLPTGNYAISSVIADAATGIAQFPDNWLN